nr:MAG TPA: hypothetical protein [Caudoviricetes sp.]
MNYEEAGIKMISEFKKKIYQRRFAHKYFDKKEHCSFRLLRI